MPFGVFNQTLPVRYAADNQVARYVTKGGFTYDVSTKRGGVTLPVKCSILLTELGLENGQNIANVICERSPMVNNLIALFHMNTPVRCVMTSGDYFRGVFSAAL